MRDKLRQLFRFSPSRRDLLAAFVGAGTAVILTGAVATEMQMEKQHKPPPKALPYAAVAIPWLPETVRHWERLINEMAQKYNVNANVVAIIMTIESGGFSGAASGAGAQGLMQVTPGSAANITANYMHPPLTAYDLNNPRTNVEIGTAFIAHLRDTFSEPWDDYTVELIAAGYNAGGGNAGRLWRGEGLPSAEATSYSRDVMNMWRERRNPTSPTYQRWYDRGGFRLIDRARAEQAGQ